ncbi:alpha/beta hydrolase [Rhizobium sp. Root482]|uniref:alpha/beta hydrolase n=1 Tax=Rhizobium sp. Root482 TaxID=1736543 RepID=UPI0006F7F01B|nr:dienelactone hydrolase family protein [Rhizobium sp. Root482]KQY14623.1 phospholipase [Rhizobium sp. Root482]
MRLSTVHLPFRALSCLLLVSCLAFPAKAAPLKPFKDELFSYETVLETADGGDYRVVDYQELRDINGRDQTPERRVKRAYLALGVKRQQVNETMETGTRPLAVTRVGAAAGAAFTVIFIHGRGGDRRLGANDYSFGGNFNRLKNLAVDNGGVYYAPSVQSFDKAGVADIAGLIAHARRQSPEKPVILACASMGNFICWGIARYQTAVEALAGLMIMGGPADPSFQKSAARKAGLPIFFSHGSADTVYPAADQIALYRALHAAGHPSRFVLFETGSHGTPVRMTDWREALNWILVHNKS